MSVLVGPVAIVAAGTVQVATPARQPGEFSHVVLDNATPYVLTILTGGNGRAIPPFTADVLALDPASLFLTGVFTQAPGGPAATTQSYLAATFYADDDELPDSLPLPLTSQLIQAALTGPVALQAGSTIGISGTPNVAVPGGVGITNTPTVGLSVGSTIGISGTPTVDMKSGAVIGITGTPNVSVSNTPTVGISAGATVGISGTPNVGIASGLADISNTATLSANGQATAWLALGGRSGAVFTATPDANFNGTLAVDLSFDGGATFATANYYGPTSLALSTSSVFTPGSGSIARVVIVPPGTTHVRVKTTAYTAGTCSVTVGATASDASYPLVANTPGVNVSNTPTVGISAGATVGISGTPNVAVPAGVGITGTATVSVSNTPTVGISAGATVGISGTPTVVAQGAATTLAPPSGTPSFAQRAAAAASTANVSSTNSAVNTTLVAAPGAGKVLELHKLQISVGYTQVSSTVGNATLSLTRSDNAAVIYSQTVKLGGSGLVNVAVDFDFEGAQLPANVGVNFVLTSPALGTGGTCTNAAQLNYTTLS